jgi:hypothetical protein
MRDDECRESVNEPVHDKKRANFCEHFQAGGHHQTPGSQNQTTALHQLEALFKKQP